MENQTPEFVQKYVADLVKKAKVAQKTFEKNYTDQRSVDEVVRAVGKIIYDNGMELAGGAATETNMGNVQGKFYKLRVTAMSQWNTMKGKKSVGVIEDDPELGIKLIAKPLGVIGCVMPSTNPIATVVGNSMMAFKCRNAVIIAPHPASAHASIKTAELIRKGLEQIGAPADLIQCIDADVASIEVTNEVLKQCDVNIATGGAAMVKSVYSSGRPAFGVGQGNCQEIIDEDYPNMVIACASAIGNRSFDLGVPCTGDQTMHVPAAREKEYLDAMSANGAFVIEDKGTVDQLRELIFPSNGHAGRPINRNIVGRTPQQIGEMLNINVPEDAKVICIKNQAKGTEDVLCKEILCPIIRYTTYTKFEDAVDAAIANLEYEGAGHSSSIWSNNEERINYAANLIPVGRFHVNQPTGGAGNGLAPTITIGCGSWGNNSISENLQYYHLMNKTCITTPLKNLKQSADSDWDDYEPYNIFND